MLTLYSADKIASTNEGYQASEFLPGGLIIGTDGGNEALVLDLRTDSDTQGMFYVAPFIGMDWKEAKFMGKSLEEAQQNFAEWIK